MCGIFGVVNYKTKKLISPDILRNMTSTLYHRGPDDEGFWIDHFVGLGQRRLSIIDLEGGHQPLSNEDQTIWITFNGEIYNYPELMKRFIQKGHTFGTQSDTETIVHAYEEYGLDFLSHLNGMYAFALWDQTKNRLVLARDPFGIKPLYFWNNRDGIIFSSEIKAFMVSPEFLPEIDLDSLDEYLTYQFVPSPKTIFKNVYKLRPGHCLIIEDEKEQIIEFSSAQKQTITIKDEQSLIEELQTQIYTSVKRQMISDVPVGSLLSGGVDSATVTAIMREVSPIPVKTFTVGFEGDYEKNELKMAQRTAQILGTEHHEVVIGSKKFFDVFEKTNWHMDEPVATSSALAMFWVSQLAAEYVKVVLTGQGVDEPWAGYRRYEGEKIGEIYRMIPGLIRKKIINPIILNLPRAEAYKRAIRALDNEDPCLRFANVYSVFPPEMKASLYQDWFKNSIKNNEEYESLKYWLAHVEGMDALGQQLFVESRFSLPDNLLLYGDKMAMAFSLEARVPFLDLELMKFVDTLPSNLKLKGLNGHKYLYRKAIRKWLPDEILSRPKIGFMTPIDLWFQNEVSSYVRDQILSQGSVCLKYFNAIYLEKIIQDHISKREDNTRQLFTLLVFENWYNQFINVKRY